MRIPDEGYPAAMRGLPPFNSGSHGCRLVEELCYDVERIFPTIGLTEGNCCLEAGLFAVSSGIEKGTASFSWFNG